MNRKVLERENIGSRAQKILKSIAKSSSADDKSNAALALSMVSLLSADVDNSVASQLLKQLKSLGY